MHVHQRPFALCVTAVLLSATTAFAQPFTYQAVLEPRAGGKAVRIPLSEVKAFPDESDSHKFDRIIVVFKNDPVSATILSAFHELTFTAGVGQEQQPAVTVRMENLEKSLEYSVFKWSDVSVPDALAPVQISVLGRYKSEFLCQHEAMLLLRSDVEDVDSKLLIDPKKPKRRIYALKRGKGQPLLYSYCKIKEPGEATPLALDDRLDWEKVLNTEKLLIGDASDRESGEKQRLAHKRALAEKLAGALNKSFRTFGVSVLTSEKDETKERDLLFVRGAASFTVVRRSGAVFKAEELNARAEPLASLIDSDSQVVLNVDEAHCRTLGGVDLFDAPWFTEVVVKDEKGEEKRTKAPLKYRDGCSRVVEVDWAELVNQRVVLRHGYRVANVEQPLVVSEWPAFKIYNLGLITTFPLASEIISAAQGTPGEDIESKSIIPVSWALSRRGEHIGTNSYAVTFPFTVSVNTRTIPDLAEYVALAPSISLIGGQSGSSTGEAGLRFAVGMGVSVARAFHFGYAWTHADGEYVLVGLSIPELLPLFKVEP